MFKVNFWNTRKINAGIDQYFHCWLCTYFIHHAKTFIYIDQIWEDEVVNINIATYSFY